MGLPRRAGGAAELRKSLKPLLEKRRRARINESLSQLKALILPLLGRESSRYSKLEKADILEMTVNFLQERPASPAPPGPAPRQPASPLHPSPRSPAAPSDSYLEGYRACLTRLTRVLPACRALEPVVSARLLEHLRRKAAGTSRDGGRARDQCRPLSPTPAPAPSTPPQPEPPGSPGFWRPW
ncbi:transcription factor HES-2 [Tenrec ecaudatus]|uniref:transcription factor HES-2 n=1 Tax=Tenrec ecaudatus TaxID=94439 RepID=UPI003F5A7AAA